jgi:putative transposase
MPSTFRRKPNRLLLEVYRGAAVYFLTLTCAQRRPAFTEERLVESCIETLRSCSERHGFAVLAYCFMPDHLHLLVEGGAGSDVPQFTKDFKQRTGYAYRRLSEEALWQKSYYDHILRREEDVREAARYIIGNPVRMGLVEAAGDHPYSGSFVWGKAIMEA